MDQVKDGGPAFPVNEEARLLKLPGMTLRDYFAAKALLAVAAGTFSNLLEAKVSPSEIRRLICKDAYEWADAMLKAREANHG